MVYAKPSVAGPEQVLDYLARYTHKSAISNHRWLSADDHSVRFRYRDRARGNRPAVLQLPAHSFLERFTTHVLPRAFVRIRHFGLLANRNKARLLTHARLALDAPMPAPAPCQSAHALCLQVCNLDIDLCPTCHNGRLLLRALLPPACIARSRAPP